MARVDQPGGHVFETSESATIAVRAVSMRPFITGDKDSHRPTKNVASRFACCIVFRSNETLIITAIISVGVQEGRI